MEIVLLILGFILLGVGLIGSVLPIIPGPPLSYIGLLLIKFSGYGDFSTIFLIIWAVIIVTITVLDYILPSLLTKKFGGSRFASVGAFLGLIIGIFYYPPWGMIIGTFIGALVGEVIHNRGDGFKALKAALGASLAFFVGTGAKLIITAIMLFYAIKLVIK